MKIQVFAKSLIVCGFVLGCVAANVLAEPIQKSATVAKVFGLAKYSVAGGPWLTVAEGTQLLAGSTVQTGPYSTVDLKLSEPQAVVHLDTNTTVRLDKMVLLPGDAQDTETQFNLRSGEVTGHVKKLSKASHLDIKTPSGVAGIRGTDFNIKVEPLPEGAFKVTYTSIEGQLVVAAVINDKVETVALETGESWVPGSEVQQASAQLLAFYKVVISEAVQTLETLPGTPPSAFQPYFVMPASPCHP
jgi:hypothetical protein